MKTTKILVIGHWSLVVGMIFVLLAGTVQAYAVDYKNSYRGVTVSGKPSAISMQTTATTPTVSFQSTSAYSDQWSQDAQQSMLNSDGSVNTGAYMSSGPNRAPGVRRAPGTPTDEDEEEEEQQPLGDGLWIMTLCALAYLIVRVARKRVC